MMLRDWVTVSQLMDPVVVERGRMQQVSSGVAPNPQAPEATLVYVALQELATRVAHFNTAKTLEDKVGYEIMKRVAADENLHFLFYRDLSTAAMELAPSEMVIAMERVVKTFNMPGTGISGYHDHTVAIADEGIYSLLIFHDNVLTPTLRTWRCGAVDRVELRGVRGTGPPARSCAASTTDSRPPGRATVGKAFRSASACQVGTHRPG